MQNLAKGAQIAAGYGRLAASIFPNSKEVKKVSGILNSATAIADALSGGSGNGFTPGSAAYFKVWKDGYIRTVVESPSQVFNGLDVQSVTLTVSNDIYSLYRNGAELVPVLTEPAYVDTMIESEMEYVYHVSATNVLGNMYESNPSGTASISTHEVEGECARDCRYR